MNYLVTRHLGSLQWLKQAVSEPVIPLHHLDDLHFIRQGDTVIGTLPIHMVANVCRQGAHYLHLECSLPYELRGQELTAQQLNKLGARLVEYHAHKSNTDEKLLMQILGKDIRR